MEEINSLVSQNPLHLTTNTIILNDYDYDVLSLSRKNYFLKTLTCSNTGECPLETMMAEAEAVLSMKEGWREQTGRTDCS